MIYSLTGILVKKSPSFAVIECAGVGYALRMPTSVIGQLPAAGQETTVYTELVLSENEIALYGFATQEQRDCFRLLTSVSGVGPKAGLSILSVMTPEKVALAASADDHKAFTAAPGVGPKLAKRIALELKDKVSGTLGQGSGLFVDSAAVPASTASAQAVAALVSLGYAASEAAAAVARVDETLPVQEIIKIALRGLSKV